MSTISTSALVRRSDTVATYGLLAAGVIHTGLTPISKPEGGQDALWFAGSGLALCLLGALNQLRSAADASPATRWWCRGANIVTTAYLVRVARALPAPHVYAVLAMAGLATAHSLAAPGNQH